MMTAQRSTIDPESLWDQLLSRQATQIQAAFASLTPEDQKAIVAHLSRMVEEEGWHPEQRLSARMALQALAKDLPSSL
jgi:uncharacterized protein YdeI (YjbR/CyaY-like superfamily)